MFWDAVLNFLLYYFTTSSFIGCVYYLAVEHIHAWYQTSRAIEEHAFSDSEVAKAYCACVYELKCSNDSTWKEILLALIPIGIAIGIFRSEISAFWYLLPAFMMAAFILRGKRGLLCWIDSPKAIENAMISSVNTITRETKRLVELKDGPDTEKNRRFYTTYSTSPKAADECIWWTIYTNLLYLCRANAVAWTTVVCITVAALLVFCFISA